MKTRITANKKIGNEAEKLASNYYKQLGFELEISNYRFKKGEVDLIMSKQNLLVFIEVKYRRRAEFGYPEEFVSESQKSLIMTAAEHFIYETSWVGNIRFDIVAVDAKMNLEVFEDAFY